jgi:predicted nucleic acid-binding protein
VNLIAAGAECARPYLRRGLSCVRCWGELDLGERTAIAVATAFSADLLLIDDARGRIEARRHHLVLTRTLGVLRTAAERRLIDVRETLERLRTTNFYAPNALIAQTFDRWLR